MRINRVFTDRLAACNIEFKGIKHRGEPAKPNQDLLLTIVEEAVSAAFEIDVNQLHQPTRGRARIALARQVTMYLAHVTCAISLTKVGALLDRDRTTVAHACQVIETRRDDPQFDRAIELLEHTVTRLCQTHLGRGAGDNSPIHFHPNA